MARRRTGTARFRNGRWYVRVTLVGSVRPTFALPFTGPGEERAADERAAILAQFADRLRAAGQLDVAPAILAEAAAATTDHAIADVRQLVGGLCAGEVVAPGKPSAATTFEDVANDWTSGRLASRYPDHVRTKRTADDDLRRLSRHVLPILRRVPMATFSLEHADRVMQALPAKLSRATRRQVAQLMHRLLGLAVFPLRLRESNPLPRGWLPHADDRRAKAFLYPDEDAKLLSCVDVPLHRRMIYGFITREGMRKGEALGLDWADLDLERGVVALDENKTEDPRAWALDPGVVDALRVWRELKGNPAPEARVFALDDGSPIPDLRPDDLRAHLQTAGVTRAQLFERSASRQPMRVHDMRATFITLSLASGRSEAWVADRTGHTTSQMINRYKRAARSVAEAELGGLVSLADAVPELGQSAPKRRRTESGTTSETASVAKSQNKPKWRNGRRGGFKTHATSSEPAQPVGITSPDATVRPGSPASAPNGGPPAPIELAGPDAVELALADALERAAKAGEWSTVTALAGELEARRRSRGRVAAEDPAGS